MKTFIADLHIHSRYSRATSPGMSPENIWKWAQLKGITVIGTGDFTHPKWSDELKEKLEPAGSGLFRLKKEFQTDEIHDSCRGDVFFLLSAEISCIYSKNGKTRKIHSIVFARDFADAARINAALSRIGNLSADGRPILGLDVKELLKIVMGVSPEAMLVPAHAWTPHFSVFGAASGFDSLEECFEDLTPHIHAIETGLSSDPAMNRRLSALDKITLISNSDAHSPAKIGREANIFDTEISYKAMMDALKSPLIPPFAKGGCGGISGTIEFFPEEGKYHYDGHRLCKTSLSPKETIKHNYLCPVCNKKVTVGVMHRVEKLADREEGFKLKGAPPFYSIIPLPEIIAEVLKAGVSSKKVGNAYQNLLQKLGSEFNILIDVPLDEIERAGSSILSEAISMMRSGNVHIAPGYDGEFGKVKIFEKVERAEIKGQMALL
ncbi:MAG: endonuclease Q family protein [Deltaproteobacteria bacterium]